MAQQVQFRRGSTAQHGSFTGAVGEVTVDTDKDTLLVHDGSTAGGKEIASLAGSQTLTNKTLTSPIINTGTFGTSILPVSADGTTLGSASKEFSDLFLADGGTIQLGNDQDVTITHVADTGILLNGSSKIQFTNAAESIHSDGSKLILTSNSVAFSLPTADGSAGQFLKTNGSGVLSFDTVSSAADDITAGDAAILITTSSGNITIDAAANDSDIILKGTDGSVDTTFLTIDGSAAGKATFNNEIVSGAVITSGAGLIIADDGNIGSASDTDAIAISSSGVVTMNQIPVFSAGINVSGGTIAGTLATAAQANITSLGTLTALTVDDIAVNGKVITMTGSTDDTAVFTVGTNGTLTIETTDTAAAAANIQITADGTFEVDATTITLDSAGDIVLDADGADVIFKDAGTEIGRFTNSSTDFVMQVATQDKDIVFKGDDGGSGITALTLDMSDAGKATFNGAITGGGLLTTGGNIVIPDAGNIGSASDTDAIAIASDGVVTMNQIPVFSAGINVSGGTIAGTLATAAQTNITTVGTLTTLTVDSIIINGTNIGHTSDTDAIAIGADGDVTLTQDLELQHDGATISFGANDDVVLTHVHNAGLTLSVPATADNSFPTFNLSAGDNDIAADDVLGEISFQAPAEGAGTDAILVAAGIAAVSEGDFAADNNATKLVFKTAASATAAETASLSSIGDFTVAGDIVIKDGGLIGSASDLDAISIAANGVVTFSQAITGQASSALYADLAEMYASDETIPEGTVVMFAGEGKLKACDVAACTKVAGIVSTDPAYLMNSAQQGVALALAGRVPCKVIGPVEAGDMMISAGNGMAKAFDADVGSPALGTVIGKAIEDHVGDETTTGVIEVLAMMM